MSAISDAFAQFQTALVAKLTSIKNSDLYFTPVSGDPTSIQTTKNIQVIGDVKASGDVAGNQNIS